MDRDENIIYHWLQHLNLEQHYVKFMEHGYDDLETVKCIGEDDLKMIGVNLRREREVLLDAVDVIRCRGAAWVYLLPFQEVLKNNDCMEGEVFYSNERTSSDSSGVESWDSYKEEPGDSEIKTLPVHTAQNQAMSSENGIEIGVSNPYEELHHQNSLLGLVKSVLGCTKRQSKYERATPGSMQLC